MPYSLVQSMFWEKTKTNSSSMPATRMNLYTQPAEQHIASVLMQSDGRWMYDDNNYNDLPIAIGNLVSGQQDYSFLTSQMVITGISVLDVVGNWHGLTPINPEDITETFGHNAGDRAQFFKIAGQPYYYTKQGNSAFLYPPPDNGVSVTLTGGLKVYFQRGPLVFDFNAGNLIDGSGNNYGGSSASYPGFNSLYHSLIVYLAAADYCLTNLPQFYKGYMAEAAKLEAALIQSETKRDKDDRLLLTMKRTAFR